jgi:F-type H+-transporting ATPase subunit b
MAEATKAHTEVPSDGHKAGFPPFQKETFASQLVWLAITLVLLYLMVRKLALPRIGGIFEQRREAIAGDMSEAQRLREQSDAALADYEKTLADARARAQAMASETHSRLAAESEERRKELETGLNAKLAEAEKSIAATRNAAMANVRGIAADAAAAIVERLIGSAPAEASVRAALDQVLKN